VKFLAGDQQLVRARCADHGTADVFVHHSVIDMGGYRTLAESQKVEYTFSQGPKGPQADQVRAV
jgi:CspA family cold shock protein